MGRDSSSSRPSCSSNVFQSTRPVWGATEIYVMVFQALKISIHAPRVGRDHQPCCQRHGVSWHFNPRAPCGARPGRRALSWHRQGISIHAPRVGRDFQPRHIRALVRVISIHAPRVGRDLIDASYHRWIPISIHAPRVGRDSKFDDFTPSNLHKRYKRVLARPKNTREKGKIKQKLAYIHAFSAFLGCEGSGTFCALVLRTQYR